MASFQGSQVDGAVPATGIQVRFTPYDRIEIEAQGLRLVKHHGVPPNWLVSAPGADRETGPLSFDEVLEWSKGLLGTGPLVEHLVEIGKFETSRDRLHAHWAKSWSRPDPAAAGVIQGITLSPGNYCSVGCAYCYAKPRFTNAPTDQTSDETLHLVFEFIRNQARVRAGCAVTIGGGGDGLENFDFYRRAVELSRQHERDYHLKIPIYLATVDPKRLLREPEMLDLILENQRWITLSIDGDEHLTYHRPRVDFRPLLERHRGRCHWGASAVFSAKTAKHIHHNYLYLLDAGFDAIQMIPARLAKSHPLHLEAEHFEVAIAQYRDLLDELGHAGRLVELFCRLTTGDALGRFFYRYLAEKEAGLRCGAGFATVFADPLGRLFPCPSSTHQSAQIGDLSTGLSSLPVLDKLGKKPEECLSCRILKACGGPCTHESLLLHEVPGQITPAVCDFQRATCDLAVEWIGHLYNEDPTSLNALFDGFVLKAGGMTRDFETDRPH
jgi:radical SAM protein with 4Fe4S-binding SPASM domain